MLTLLVDAAGGYWLRDARGGEVSLDGCVESEVLESRAPDGNGGWLDGKPRLRLQLRIKQIAPRAGARTMVSTERFSALEYDEEEG